MTKRDTDLGEQFGMEKDAAYDTLKAKQEGSAKAKGVLRGAGYARGGGVSPMKKHSDEKEDKALIKKELSHAKIKVKHGGKIDGKKTAMRADKFKRGGSVPKGHHTRVNINVGAGEAEKQNAMKTGMALGAKMAAAKMAGPRPDAGAAMQARGPAAPAPMGGMPPGGGGAPAMQKRGGRTYAAGGKVKGVQHLTGGAGAGGGEGRLAKIRSYGTKPKK